MKILAKQTPVQSYKYWGLINVLKCLKLTIKTPEMSIDFLVMSCIVNFEYIHHNIQ